MSKLSLTDDEVIVLDEIATVSKMDCWFYIEYNDNKNKYEIFDLEENKLLDTETGVYMLLDGMTEYDMSTLTPNQLATLCNLAYKVGIAIN